MKVFIAALVGAVFFVGLVKCNIEDTESSVDRCEELLGGVCVDKDADCQYHYVFSNLQLCDDSCHHCCLPDVDEDSCEDIGGYCYDPRVHVCDDNFITGLCPSSLIHRCCFSYPRKK